MKSDTSDTNSLVGLGCVSSAGIGCAILINTGCLTHMLRTQYFVHMCQFPYTLPKVGQLHNLKCSNPHVGQYKSEYLNILSSLATIKNTIQVTDD